MRAPSSFRFLSAFIILILGIFWLGESHAGYFDPKLKWYTLTTEHFNIHYHNGTEVVAQRMAGIAEKVFAEQSAKFKWKPWGRTEVVVTDTTDLSNAFTTTLPYNYILLFVAVPPGDSTLNFYDDWLHDLFLHEYTHTLHLDMYGGIVKPFRWVLGRIVTPNGLTPGWVREGIAVQQESLDGKGRANNSFSEMMLRTDILNDQFLPIDQMAGLQFEWPSSNAAYIYGGKLWDYLADTYGQEKVIEFSKRYSDSMWLFSLNNKARKTFEGKNWHKLHQEWKEHLTKQYQQQKQELEAKGLTQLNDLAHVDKGSLGEPTLSPDGKFLIYSKTDLHNKPEIRRVNIDGSGDERVYKGRVGTQYSFSPDGKKVVYSAMGSYKFYYKYYELFELDLASGKSSQLTTGQRAFHPDYSPDGKSIVFVKNLLNGTQLGIYDVASKKTKLLGQAETATQFSFPRFARDGRSIAVSAWRKGNRDIYIYDLNGAILKQVTQDKAIDVYPAFSKDGQDLYFSSDRSGITNVYRYNLASGAIEQVSNILTGLFAPQFSGDKMVVQHYYGRGYDLKVYDFTPAPIALTKPEPTKVRGKKRGKKNVVVAAEETVVTPSQGDLAIGDPLAPKIKATSRSATEPTEAAVSAAPAPVPAQSEAEIAAAEAPLEPPPAELTPKKYNPFKKLFIPRYIMPNIYFGDSVTITADIGSADPLGWHRWTGGLSYRFDANHLGGQFSYTYNRLKPTIFANFYNFDVDYGDIFGIGQSFFEERSRASVGASIGTGRHALAGYYFFEHRSADSTIPPGAVLPPTLGNFSGFGLRYSFTRVDHFPASISLEGGPRLQVSFEATDSALGSSPNNEQIIFSGDLREYIPLPWDGHVFGIRLAGGIAWGDKLLQGTFRLGSALGEGTLAAVTPRLFTLRGLPNITFAGERGMLISGEYRLPLIQPQRGISTWPVYLKNMHMAFFADYGSVWNGDIDFDNFLLGVGAELRGDFILGYGLPITARLGYGIIVVGRQFIRGLKDPILNTDISNGTLILQLGTSF